MKRTILIAAALAVALVSCNQKEDDFAGTVNSQFVEFKTDGTSYFNVETLQTNFTSTVSDLSQEEIDGLLQMREEEKMAQDVYLKFYELWGKTVFSNIAKSESSHTSAVLSLLTHFGLSDPASTETGVFTNQNIQNLYDELVDAGSESALKAFETGAFIEEYDILDLETLLSETTNADIQLVYENLLKGSRNHLRAFVKQINVYGVSYIPLLLSEEYYQEIVSSEMENGSGNARWGNAGNGKYSQGSVSYNDCINSGTGGLNGSGNGTSDCDGSGGQNTGSDSSYGNGTKG